MDPSALRYAIRDGLGRKLAHVGSRRNSAFQYETPMIWCRHTTNTGRERHCGVDVGSFSLRARDIAYPFLHVFGLLQPAAKTDSAKTLHFRTLRRRVRHQNRPRSRAVCEGGVLGSARFGRKHALVASGRLVKPYNPVGQPRDILLTPHYALDKSLVTKPAHDAIRDSGLIKSGHKLSADVV
jgi:hypothetical protein